MLMGRYSLVMVSSKLSKTRDTTVQAAAWAGVPPSGSFGGWAGSSAANSHGLASGAAKRPSSFFNTLRNVVNSSAVGLRARQRRKA